MGQVAEVFTGMGQELAFTEGAVIEVLTGTDATQQLWPVTAHVAEEGMHQAGLAMAVTKQQHRVSGFEHEREAMQVVIVERSPLARDITVMPMAEVLLAAPQAVGAKGGVIHLITIQPIDIGTTMVHAHHQASSLIATGNCRHSNRVAWGDAGLLEKMPQAQHIISSKNRMLPPCRMVHPGFTAIGQPQPKPRLIESFNLATERVPQPHQVIPANVVAQGMGKQGIQGVLVVEAHGRESED